MWSDTAQNSQDQNSLETLNVVLRSIKNEPEKMRNWSKLHGTYIEKRGTESHISRFINKIEELIKGELFVFKASGLASIIMRKE